MMPYQPYQSTWQNPFLPQYNQGQPVQQIMQPYQQPVNGIVKVNGPQSAMQIQLPPNSTSQPLIDAGFDGKKGMMYVVSTDGTGTKSLEWYDFKVHENGSPVVVDGVEFASKKELDELAAKVGVIMEVIHGSNATVPATVPATDSAAGRQGTNGTAPVDDAGRPIGANL